MMKTMMKRYSALILLTVVVLLLGACGGTPAAPAATATTAAKEADATATQSAQVADATATQEVAATAIASEIAATPVPMESTSAAPRTDLIRASKLVDYAVHNLQDENLGTVHDLIVGRSDEDLAYAVLGIGGFLGIGDKLVIVPWWAFTLDQTNSLLILNIDPQVLKDAPVYGLDELPVVTDPTWDADIVAFWKTVEGAPSASMPMTTTHSMTETVAMTETGDMSKTRGVASVISLSALEDYSVKDPQGKDLGSIEDIMINPYQGRVEYMILSFGGFLGIDDKWFAFPLNATELQVENKTIVLDVTPEMLEAAPGFNKDELPSTVDPNWDQDIRDYWQQSGSH